MKLQIGMLFTIALQASATDYFVHCEQVREEYVSSYYFVSIKERAQKYIMKFDYFDDDDYGYRAPMAFNYVKFSQSSNLRYFKYSNSNIELKVDTFEQDGEGRFKSKLRFYNYPIMDMLCY